MQRFHRLWVLVTSFKLGIDEWLIEGRASALAMNVSVAVSLLMSPSLRGFGLFYSSGRAWLLGLEVLIDSDLSS